MRFDPLAQRAVPRVADAQYRCRRSIADRTDRSVTEGDWHDRRVRVGAATAQLHLGVGASDVPERDRSHPATRAGRTAAVEREVCGRADNHRRGHVGLARRGDGTLACAVRRHAQSE